MSAEKAGRHTEQTEKLPETKISKQADYARDMLEKFGRAGFDQMIKGTALENDFADENLFKKVDEPAAARLPGSIGQFEYKANVDLVNAVIELQTKVWGKNTREIDGWLGRKTLSRLSIWSSREKRIMLRSKLSKKAEAQGAIDIVKNPDSVVLGMDSLLKASAHVSHQLRGENAVRHIGDNGRSVERLRIELEQKTLDEPGFLKDKIYVLAGQGNDFAQTSNASWRAYESALPEKKMESVFYKRLQQLIEDTEASIQTALISGAKHVVISGRIQYNLSQRSDYQGRNEMRKMYEKWAKDYSSQNERVSFYDANQYFPEPLVTYDGSHPSWSNPQSKRYYADNWQYLRKHILDETAPVPPTVASASTANPSVEG